MDEQFISPTESEFSVKKSKAPNTELDPLASNHQTWSTRYKCFLAFYSLVLCYTNILRFCISMGKYKMIIIIPYVLLNMLVGVPALLTEIMLGRFVMGNVSNAWNMCPPARGTGLDFWVLGIFWCLVAVTGYLIVLNYLVISFLFKYLWSSLGGRLTWESCEKPWAQINCYKLGKKSDATAKCMATHSEEFCHNLTWESSGTQFWKYSYGNKDDIAEFSLSTFFLLASICVVAMIIYKKTQSLEKVLGMLVYPSLVLGVIFMLVTFYAANPLDGFKKLCHFKWDEIVKPKIWVAALEDTICLLGLGKVSLTFISSHGKFTDNILFDILMVILGSFCTCLLLGFPILNIIAGNRDIEKLETDEPLFQDIAEIFISVSEALLVYPYPKTLWASMYYLGCILVSFSSQAVLVLSFCESLEDVLKRGKKTIYTVIIICVTTAFSVLTIFGSLLRFVDSLNQATVVVEIILLYTITWQMFYGIRKFNYDYHFMMGYPLPNFIKFTWITLPLATLIGLIVKMYFRIPDRPVNYIVFIYVGVIFLMYILVILYKAVKLKMHKEKVSKVFMANPNWGPDNPLMKRSRAVFDTSTVNREFMYRQELYKKPFIKPTDFSEQNIVQLI